MALEHRTSHGCRKGIQMVRFLFVVTITTGVCIPIKVVLDLKVAMLAEAKR